ncbi:serine protease Do [Sulfitobacter undariae]|uniref:Probable periplasmic serine endoprotease DegP-like n=1 Tax=Sulfitobacter undariae TaxID=1563671 RepID=A0A7W6E1U1_9RHOB|nr:trypsin-like peptidase domain-containing protein [Sulfitobacter undariae]MBB3993158.1 serine protease Do [Sulfitobacter undariae]
MTSLLSKSAPLALAAAMALSPMLAPTAAFAVPAGGYADLVEEVAPAVVFIEVTSLAKAGMQLPPNIPQALRKQLEDQMSQGAPRGGLGSGFLISADGKIVTNNHVVADAQTVRVTLTDGRKFDAEVVGTDVATDIALLSIKADVDLPFVKFGASDDMRVGDEVVAVGNPFGLSSTVTTGIISAKARDINSGPYDEFLQTDAAINRGNSGGPLFNNAGDVIGMNTAILSPDGGSVGIGFAVPSDVVSEVVADLGADGSVTRGWLGVSIRPMSDEVANVLGYDASKGAVVEAVSADSPADTAGLERGDIILDFDGTAIDTLRDLTRAVAAKDPDDKTSLTVLRRGKEMKMDVTIGVLAPQKT